MTPEEAELRDLTANLMISLSIEHRALMWDRSRSCTSRSCAPAKAAARRIRVCDERARRRARQIGAHRESGLGQSEP